jgi:hypothetical protein
MNGAIFDEAFKRGIVAAAVVFLTMLASTLQVDGLTTREIVGLCLGPAMAAFGVRAGYETFIDTRRANAGRMLPSDVPVVSNAVTVVENVKPNAGDPVLSEEPK